MLDLKEEIVNAFIKDGTVTKIERISKTIFQIKNLKGINYLFKINSEQNQKYRTVLIEKMANLANISAPHTIQAKLDEIEGELIEDYRKEDYLYTPGGKILLEYYFSHKNDSRIQKLIPDYILKKEKFNENDIEEILKRLNNLEIIWDALLYHFRNYEKKEEITNHIMQELAKRFCFDFITMQRDRHANNWEIEEKEPIKADLTPMFDNNRSFSYPSFLLQMKVSDQYKITETYEELEYYLTYSDKIFTDYFYSLYELFTKEQIYKLCEELKIPKYERIEITASYNEHYNQLTNLVNKRRKKK